MLKIIFTALSPIIFYLLVGSILLSGNHKWLLLSMAILYYIFGFFSKTKKQRLWFGVPFLILLASTLFLKDALVSIVLLYLIVLPISIYLGYISKKTLKIIMVYIAFLTFIFYYGIDNWNSFLRNYHARTNEKSPKIELLTNNNQLVQLDTIQNKIIVLDFWTTSCGVCFKQFPDFEKIYLSYKNNPNIAIYSVNIPIKKDTLSKTKNLVKKLAYKFPTLYANSSEISKKFGFNTYPHCVILKNGKVRYNGRLEVATNVKIHNLKNEINLLLKE